MLKAIGNTTKLCHMRRKKPDSKKKTLRLKRKKKDGEVEMVANGENLEQSWNGRFGKQGFQKAGRRNGEIWNSIGGVVPRNSLPEINKCRILSR